MTANSFSVVSACRVAASERGQLGQSVAAAAPVSADYPDGRRLAAIVGLVYLLTGLIIRNTEIIQLSISV